MAKKTVTYRDEVTGEEFDIPAELAKLPKTNRNDHVVSPETRENSVRLLKGGLRQRLRRRKSVRPKRESHILI